MYFKKSQNSTLIEWTRHALEKMKYYRLSIPRLKRLLKNPDHQQEGIVPGTIALMQYTNSKKTSEIWLMYQALGKGKKKIITVWRYPGRSPKQPFLSLPPEENLDSLIKIINLKRD